MTWREPYKGRKDEDVYAACSHPSRSGRFEHFRHDLRLNCLIIYLVILGLPQCMLL